MRGRFFLIALALTLGGMLFYILIANEMIYSDSIGDREQTLKAFAADFDVTDVLDGETARNYSERSGGGRVTFFSLTGEVIADTGDMPIGTIYDGSEFSEAIRTGAGVSVVGRVKPKTDAVYYAYSTENGVVRLTAFIDSRFGLFAKTLAVSAWFTALDVALCMLFTFMMTDSLLKPVEELARDSFRLARTPLKAKYPELEPLVRSMNALNAEISNKLDKIRTNGEVERLILDSMEHGIVLFRAYDDVIQINRVAAKLLDYSVLVNRVSYLETDTEIKNAISEKRGDVFYREFGNRSYELHLTYHIDAWVLLITDVTEIKRAERSKNEFISNVTHEMNTPLTSIKGYAELIGSGLLNEKKNIESAQVIIKQSERLSNLITGIINFSAIDSEDLPCYEVDLNKCISETLLVFAPAAAERHIEIKTVFNARITLLSRQERVSEILNNLISNAIRYNIDGGTITIETDNSRLVVSDTGVGISDEDLEKIFDRFYTVDKSHSGSGGGFGLGLAIVKKLCKKQGWKFSVVSSVGEGTSFTVGF